MARRSRPLGVEAYWFPNLRQGEYWIVSCPARYNCVGWALGDDTQWWQGETDLAYWPSDVPSDGSFEAYEALFRSRGYEWCDGGELEPKVEKLAVYRNEKGFRHVAWQSENGTWLSKLGESFDIEHATAKALEGDDPGDGYGTARFMKRPRRGTRACPE